MITSTQKSIFILSISKNQSIKNRPANRQCPPIFKIIAKSPP